jgi:hypothetical protein
MRKFKMLFVALAALALASVAAGQAQAIVIPPLGGITSGKFVRDVLDPITNGR